MDVAILILCWRHTEHLPALLESIAAQGDGLRHTTVVCHNEAGVDHATGPQHIYSGGNLGYGGGNNHAIAWARRTHAPRYFLVLNSDVRLGHGALEALVACADAHPEAAIIGPLLVDPRAAQAVPQRGCRYHPLLSLIRPVPADRGGRIDYLGGGALLLRAAAFPRDPVFADHYFLFFEELELARRARDAGHTLHCCADARVEHLEGATRNGILADDYRPAVIEYFENLNALRFTREHHPACLPGVLLFRLLAKPAALCWRGQRDRLAFWRLAVGDFFRRRVRRFPFQQGWSPHSGRDATIDVALPPH